MSTPQPGQHHDLFQIKEWFVEICTLLKQAGINLKDLFLNADPGFDSQSFRQACETENSIANQYASDQVHVCLEADNCMLLK